MSSALLAKGWVQTGLVGQCISIGCKSGSERRKPSGRLVGGCGKARLSREVREEATAAPQFEMIAMVREISVG